MRKKFLLLLALLFLLAGVIFILPAVRDHAPEQTKESATEETESVQEDEILPEIPVKINSPCAFTLC